MKKTRFLTLMLLLSIAIPDALATKIKDGEVFLLVNVATGKAVSNGNVGTHNTYLSVADVDNTSPGQEWTFV